MNDTPIRLIVSNYNKRFTGVSATIAALFPLHAARHDAVLTGKPLPFCPPPLSFREAVAFARKGPGLTLWHVRRNSEMSFALFARDVLRCPVKLIFTSAAQRLHSFMPRQLIARMDAVIATTDEAAGFVPHVRAVVPHGVDVARFLPSPDRQKSWQDLGFGGTAGVAIIGRIRPEKGTDRFIGMALTLLKQQSQVTALIIGRIAPEHMNFAEGLKRDIAAAGLSKRIIFTGELPPERLSVLVPALSLLIAPARYEGYGLTPLEAMASGVPVLATDVGYYRRFVTEGDTGFVIGAEAEEAVTVARLADKAAALLADPARIDAMGQSARARVVAEFSIQRERDGIEAVYRQVLRQAGQ